MNANKVNDSESPKYGERPSKRQKFDPFNSTTFNTSENDAAAQTDWDPERIRKEFEMIRRKLSQTEATAIQCHKIRMQTEKSLGKEKNQLEMQIEMDKVLIAELQADLKKSKTDKQVMMAKLREKLERSTREARRAQAAAESKLSQLKIIIQQRINPLMSDSNSKATATAELVQEEVQLMKNMDNDSGSQKDLNPQNIELEQAKITIQRMTQEPVRIDEDETLQHICEDESMKKSSGEGDVEMPEDSSWARDHNSTSSDQANNEAQVASGEKSSSSNDKTDVEGLLLVTPEDQQQGTDDLKTLVGRKYSVLTSPKFFEVNWNEEYTHPKKNEWTCRHCTFKFGSKEAIQDHVWHVHYEGTFQCPYCPYSPSCAFPWRSHVREHIKKNHGELSKA